MARVILKLALGCGFPVFQILGVMFLAAQRLFFLVLALFSFTHARACKGAVTSTLLTLPAAGTGNNDHNPDRVKPREVLNIGFGTDNLLHREGHKRVTLAVDIANLTNKVAAYNFLSTFSGTHFLQPRSVTARFGLVF